MPLYNLISSVQLWHKLVQSRRHTQMYGSKCCLTAHGTQAQMAYQLVSFCFSYVSCLFGTRIQPETYSMQLPWNSLTDHAGLPHTHSITEPDPYQFHCWSRNAKQWRSTCYAGIVRHPGLLSRAQILLLIISNSECWVLDTKVILTQGLGCNSVHGPSGIRERFQSSDSDVIIGLLPCHDHLPAWSAL